MEKKQELKYLVRVMNTDLKGDKRLNHALTQIKGIGNMFANAVCQAAEIDKHMKAGHLTEEQVAKMNDVIKNPVKYNIPDWMLNRRFDPETGENRHILTSDVAYIRSNDIKRLQKIKSYRGIRHHLGLPLRGQRTRSNFRRSKSKGKGGSLGVSRKK